MSFVIRSEVEFCMVFMVHDSPSLQSYHIHVKVNRAVKVSKIFISDERILHYQKNVISIRLQSAFIACSVLQGAGGGLIGL